MTRMLTTDDSETAIIHLQAQLTAVCNLLVHRGLCSEADLNRCFTESLRTIEARETEELDRRRQEQQQLIKHKVGELGIALRTLFEARDPDVQVNVFYADDIAGGCMFSRVVSTVFEGATEAERKAMLRPAVSQYTKMPEIHPNERMCCTALTPAERAASPASLQFDLMYEESRRA